MSCRKPSEGRRRDSDRETKKEGEVRDAMKKLGNWSLNRITSVCPASDLLYPDLFLLYPEQLLPGWFHPELLSRSVGIRRPPQVIAPAPVPFLNSSWVVMACWMYHTYHSHRYPVPCFPSSHESPSSVLGFLKILPSSWFTYISFYLCEVWCIYCVALKYLCNNF